MNEVRLCIPFIEGIRIEVHIAFIRYDINFCSRKSSLAWKTQNSLDIHRLWHETNGILRTCSKIAYLCEIGHLI